jgi:hypothetical protein
LVAVDDIVSTLGASIGEREARQAIERALARLGIEDPEIPRQTTLHILELVAATPGSVGVCARFTRSRFLLQWAGETLERVANGINSGLKAESE